MTQKRPSISHNRAQRLLNRLLHDILRPRFRDLRRGGEQRNSDDDVGGAYVVSWSGVAGWGMWRRRWVYLRRLAVWELLQRLWILVFELFFLHLPFPLSFHFIDSSFLFKNKKLDFSHILTTVVPRATSAPPRTAMRRLGVAMPPNLKLKV